MLDFVDDMASGGALVPPTVIGDICAARDTAMAKIREAAATLTEGYRLASEANEIAAKAHQGARFYLSDRTEDDHYKRLFQGDFDADKSLEVYRKQLDASVWVHLLERVGVEQIMDKTAKGELQASLLAEVPEISAENVSATIEHLFSQSDLIFKRGLATAFSKLDRRFKSHDSFKIGSRIILTYVFNDWGSWHYSSRHGDTLMDIERVFAVLDGKTPNPGALVRAVDDSRGRGLDPRQSECVTEYFKIRGFKNGNAHVWFMRDDLVEKANQDLADYYGDVIGDAMAKDATAEDLKHRPGLPAKQLQFFPTPAAVVERMLDIVHVPEGARVLEPSAGTGNIAKAAAAKGAQVRAVEIHPERAGALAAENNPNIEVISANFLQMPATVEFDLVLMNPPFAGTHWIDHVMHAFAFLKPGGRLVAVLPVTAEIGESKRHQAFRQWCNAETARWHGAVFRDLPPESFAAVGTRINTVTLELMKERA